MGFSFYPKHEHKCPHVSHCPHLGGAALGTLVLLANGEEQSRRALHATIDAERTRNERLVAENERLQRELDQVKLELKLERQNKFATNQQKRDSGDTTASATTPAASDTKKKRGAPVGHPGWYRKTPTAYDWAIDVSAPARCPQCQGHVTTVNSLAPAEHLQEDILDGRYRVVLYRHQAAPCDDCDKLVQKPGDGEILHSRIGPRLRSMAIYLRNVIGISYRKIPKALEEMFGITFTPAALIGFETMLGEHFTGTLVTDCYAGYEAHIAGAKQKCQSHLARTARDWQKLTEDGSADFAFFDAIREFVRKGCRFHRLRQQGQLTEAQQETEKVWLRERLLQLIAFPVSHGKAVTLQKRILKHQHEWLVFLDDPRVPPTNNEAERALRPLVVLRKITFGHRSDAGAVRMARLMTVAETAKRHGHRPSDIYYRLFTQPPGRVLRRLYDDS
ncbi:MAG: transposase [Planctomycetota bacterium]